MSVVIVGAGEVGYHVAERLSNEGHQVVVVDLDPDRLDYVQSHLDVGVIEGNGASPSVLERAGIANATLFVAVTSVDEVNLVGCTAARGRPDMTRVARISNPDFYTEVAMASVNTSVFANFRSTLDANGLATASLNIPGNLSVPSSGLTLHHAYVVYGTSGFHMASNAVPITLR